MKSQTRNLRYTLIKLLSPSIWKASQYGYMVDDYPKPATLYTKKQFGNEPIKALEIGVAKGLNAKSMLETLNIHTLYLVDPYISHEEHQSVMGSKDDMLKRVEKWVNQVIFIHGTSDNAVADIPSDLDFIYIDGNHSYNQVWRDLTHYRAKLNEGGILAGHDFTGVFPGVVLAVVEYAQAHGLQLQASKADWWLQL